VFRGRGGRPRDIDGLRRLAGGFHLALHIRAEEFLFGFFRGQPLVEPVLGSQTRRAVNARGASRRQRRRRYRDDQVSGTHLKL
jgi:hypothetical protein